MKKFNAKSLISAVSVSLLLTASACHNMNKPTDAVNSLSGQYKETEARLSTYAQNAFKAGETAEALATYERLYNREAAYPGKIDAEIVLNYAQLLRKSGNAEKAVEVLDSHVEGISGSPKGKLNYLLANEYAASLIEAGDFKKADMFLNRVLEDSRAKEYQADAFNLRGVLLNNQEKYKEAETSFRQALDLWKGNSSSVKNNLAICLASQGLFDESLFTLRQAMAEAPNKEEIAYNIKLISDLRNAIIPTAEPFDITK